ncbi:MAG: urea ABC transporter ATP-binding protein UrtD [Pseudomonadota bacterium]
MSPINRRGVLRERGIPSLDATHGTVLYLEGVSVSFDGFKAIDDLSLYINDGELRCIIGPNGAGKTTLMDIITGKTRPDAGEAWFGQTIDLLQLDEAAIANLGIGRKFQQPTVFDELSVAQNLELAMAGPRTVFAVIQARMTGEQHDRLDEVLSRTGLLDLRKEPAGTLSHGQKQWLEIGMLLMQEPRLLLVDEPATGMTHQEMEQTGELLLSLSGDHSVVVVEHDMDFVRSLQSPVTVLHQGSVLAEGSLDSIQNNAAVRSVYLGE